MVDNKTLNSVVRDIIVHNIRNYILQYYPACEQPAMQSCKGNNASAVDALAVRTAELLKAGWITEMEAYGRVRGESNEQIVADAFSAMMQNNVIRMHIDCACFQLAAMIVSSIVCGPGVREAANECLDHMNLKA